MRFDYILDSYAWVEYYIGSKPGLIVKKIVETKNTATPLLVIAELADKFIRENEDFSKFFQFINSKSKILPLTVEISLEAGKTKFQMRKKFKQFGLMDSMIYLTAKLTNSILLTGDMHLKELDNVKFIS